MKNVGFQGNHGTFSEIATLSFFKGESINQKPYSSFLPIFDDVQNGTLDYAMIPVENTTTGMISRTYDLFQNYPSIHAIGEIIVPIVDDLIGLPGAKMEEITEVYSHPEAIGQCAHFFRDHPNCKPIFYQDTAQSVAYVKQCQDPHKAAIASSLAAQYYEMETLCKGVQDRNRNMTRFFCVTGKEEVIPNSNKISVMFVCTHEPGSLFQVLRVLADAKINLLQLESRPMHGKVFEYCFYMDFTGDIQDSNMQKILEEMKQNCQKLQVIGCYPAAANPLQ